MRCSKVFPGLFALWNFIWEQGLNLAIFHLLLPILGKSYPYIKQTSPVLTMTVLHNFGNKSTKEIVFCLLNSAWTRVMCYAQVECLMHFPDWELKNKCERFIHLSVVVVSHPLVINDALN